MTAGLETLKKKGVTEKEIPEHLIYEMYMGQPIYYRGYEEVLAGTKTFEQIMGDSSLQGWLKTWLGHIFINLLYEKGYEIIVGELGITFKKGDWRAADVAIFKVADFELNNQYTKAVPEFIFEIDTKANTKQVGGYMKYVSDKTNQYLEHGVKKVFWIFTNAGAVLEASEKDNFQVNSWDKDLQIMEGVTVNIAQMIENRRKPTA